MSTLPVVAVVGPTAAGKTELSLDLAERLGGEIVNTDAMQVYRGMDIGTAKLAPAERRGIAHHLLDLLDVTQTATVAEFQTMARAVIDDCRARGVVPVLVGGSALYTRAVLDRFEFPGTDPELRHALEEDLDEVGAEALHERLRDLDPETAAKVPPSNTRRVVRALEVITLTGKPFTASLPERSYVYDDARPGRRAHPATGARRAHRPTRTTDVGRRTRRGGATTRARTGCARAARRTARSATGRCWHTSTASSRRRRRSSRP